MYTILDGKIYLIENKNLVECVIKNGKFTKTNAKIERPANLERVSTYEEIRRNFATKFLEEEEESEPIKVEPKMPTSKKKVEEEE